MKNRYKLWCKLVGHIWENDTMHPVHGYRDEPNSGSYCLRCGVIV